MGSRTLATRANTSGSWAATHSSFGAVKPGIARLPVMRRASGTAASSAAHSAPERPSFQRMAGRSTPPRASRRVAPCIWPESPIARVPASAPPCSALSPSTARPVALHQSSGACSDQRGRGVETSSGADACPTMRSPPSSRTAFTPDVPRSMPRYTPFPPVVSVPRAVERSAGGRDVVDRRQSRPSGARYGSGTGHSSDSSIPPSFMKCFCKPRLSDAAPCTGTEMRTIESLLAYESLLAWM